MPVQVDANLMLIQRDVEVMWKLRYVKVSNNEKRLWFGCTYPLLLRYNLWRRCTPKKLEPLYSVRLPLADIFYKPIGLGFSGVDCIRKMLVISKHISWYIKLVHWYKIKQNVCERCTFRSYTILAAGSIFKNDENAFYFTLKALLLLLTIFKYLSWCSGHAEKQLD